MSTARCLPPPSSESLSLSCVRSPLLSLSPLGMLRVDKLSKSDFVEACGGAFTECSGKEKMVGWGFSELGGTILDWFCLSVEFASDRLLGGCLDTERLSCEFPLLFEPVEGVSRFFVS